MSSSYAKLDKNERKVLTFPGASIAPPMTTTSLTLRKVSGSFAAAIARLVSGPTATIVTVFGSFSAKISSITSWAGFKDGTNRECFSLTASNSDTSSGDRFSGVGRKSDFHVSSGDKWGCCDHSQYMRIQWRSYTYARM
jgi:hypothetical protein